jgi:ribosomal protein S14
MPFENPFNEGTRSYNDYETLKDLEWHCAVCELENSQAKSWQTWRDAHGLQFDKGNPDSNNWDKRQRCENCGRTTVHRKLRTLERLETTSARANISAKVAARVKKLYGHREAVLLRELPANLLEVDHKFPQIRWNTDEKSNDDLTDAELMEKFVLLTRSDNLKKSRTCERCVRTNVRGSFPGIHFWYHGDENWRTEPHNEKGCNGCFWYDPYKWRDELNKVISDSQNT